MKDVGLESQLFHLQAAWPWASDPLSELQSPCLESMMITHNVVVGCKSQTLQITPGALSKRSCRQSYCDVGRVKYSFTLTSKKIWGSHRLTKLHPNGLSPTSAISRDKGPGGWLPLFFQLTEMCADCAAEHLLLAAQRR